MKRRTLGLAALGLLLAVSAFAQFNPAPGGSVLYDLYAPYFLAGGADSVAELSPAADALNPAASGATQRLTLDLSYVALIGTTSGDAGWGHALNAGVTWPTRAGVLSGSGRFISATFPSLQLGTSGILNVSFAKDLFPKLLVGVGLGAQFGADWGLWGDLGFIHLPGDLGFMKDFRWGVALHGLGKGVTPGLGYTALPEPFTPIAGVAFDLLQLPKLVWSLHSDLSLPSFQNVRLNLGTELTFADLVSLQLATSWDVTEVAQGGMRDIPLSFGASVKLGTSVKKNASELKTTAGVAPLQNGIWAAGLGLNLPIGLIDRKPPAITLDTTTQYISPNLDGTKDDLVTGLGITDERYIKGYRFLVLDEAGNQLREIVNKDERPENVTFKNILARLVYVKTGITVPEQIRWDGRSDAGSVVPDGRYTFLVEAWDDNGNVGKSATGTVIVDNTPPSVEVKAPYLIFSPNNDGNKDTLPLQQSGSPELQWEGAVLDSTGQEVKRFSWQNAAPAPLVWDGRNEEGVLAPDGVYAYRVAATDQAGNRGSAQLSNILVDTQATPINIKISDSYFSPNDDGVKDAVQFNLQIPVTTGIESWTLAVVDEAGSTSRTFSGTKGIPASVVFDGKDDSGKILAEGSYVGRLSVLYQNGNNPTAESPQLTIDLTPPSASVSADLAIFSPDGDGNKDTVTVFQETSEEVMWTGLITDIDGRTVQGYTWRGRADAKIQWGGTSDTGQPVPDGIYFYSLAATDRAGNRGESKRVRFEINTQATDVFLSTDLTVFSPNADGVKDRIVIQPRLRVTEGVASYELRVLDTAGKLLRSVKGQNRAPQDFGWDGLDDSGRRLPDGSYQAELVLDYQKGDHHVVRTPAFTIDTQPPTIELSAEYGLFSPDGDGERDKLPVRQSSSEEELWQGEFLNAKGEVVRSYYWKGAAASFQWDGKDENGNKIPDGVYAYRVGSTDKAGNKISKELKGLTMDTRATTAFLTVSTDGFSPNGDGVADTIELKPYVGLADGIQAWALDMVSAEAGVQKSFSGAAPVPDRVVWDGRKDGGGLAREGNYQAVLTVAYLKGNKPVAQSTPFRLDVSAPQAEITVAPQPFSPDNDGVDDELTIALKVTDPSAVSDWTLEIRDPVGNPFWKFSGKGAPAERIIWNGLSDTGELVQSAEDYTMRFSAADRLGNARTVEKTIPVDVLVIRDGDQLRIRISSITFPGNSADLAAVADLEKAARNDRTLARLAEIFKKYSAYRILIEGHANITRYADPKAAQKENEEELIPLSLARAEAVKRALISLGLDGGRISVTGLGGSKPVVRFDDLENVWKNRRVEFILIKK
jgi:flagellar hook assembly protein FlgD/outer membrane protein OmpA-like peptidoglycan-associated protein